VDTVAIDDARRVLTTIRVELHRRAGREQNRLLLQEQDQVAAALDAGDSDALMRAVATAGRTIAWEGDDAWRRRGAWSRQHGGGGGPRYRPCGGGRLRRPGHRRGRRGGGPERRGRRHR
jgi:[protein-PII] uridylyltransferase